MKKNKGFTLIELLAVIIVLAIIALIATPIVMNTIKNSKKNSAQISGQAYIKQVGTTIMEDRLKNGKFINDGTYIINSDGNLTGNGLEEPFEIPMSGKKPSSGTIIVKNGLVDKESSIIIGDYEIFYDENIGDFIADVKLEIVCNAVSNLSWQQNVESGSNYKIEYIQPGILASDGNPYAYGVEYSCDLGDGEEKTFYVLEDGDTTTLTDGRIAQAGEVSLIMSSDISKYGESIIALSSLRYRDDWKGANKNWKDVTRRWIKINKNQISMPSAYQIAQASGRVLVDTNDMSFELKPWLIINIDSQYFTSTLTPSSDSVFIVNHSGLSEMPKGGDDWGGRVRPVITISKRQINTKTVSEVESDVSCVAVTKLSTQLVTNYTTGELEYIDTGVLASDGNPYAYGVEYSCNLGDGEEKTFYVLEDGDTTTLTDGRIAQAGEVSLIMNKNIDLNGKGRTGFGVVAWDGTVKSTNGPESVFDYLKMATGNWKNLSESKISLATTKQIIAAAGNIKNNFPTWMCENLYNDGYSSYWLSDVKAQGVGAIGTFIYYGSSSKSLLGVRPVITISKENISY